jgi:SAM-dependent methyltransferase
MDQSRRHELEHHEELYSGFAQQHFAKPAVRAFREYLVQRMLQRMALGPRSRVLSLGCGIGDTERLLAPHTGWVHGIDLSPKGVEEARRNALPNMSFSNAALEEFQLNDAPYDAVIAIFFLHHLAADLPGAARRIRGLLREGGVFYAIDPSRYRLSGMVGRLVVPHLMRRYQTEGEEPLARSALLEAFHGPEFSAECGYFDFVSTPLAGLFPSWRMGYRAARVLDELLIHAPVLRRLSSNLELVAWAR